jgi:predicted Zn-dependent protease
MNEPIRATVHVEGEPAPLAVEVRVTDRVEAQAGERVFSIPLSELVLEPGGFEGDFVFCRAAGFTIAVRDPRFVAMLGERADERLRGELAKVGAHRKKHARGKWIGIGAAVAVLALMGVVIASVPTMLASGVDALPASIDRQLGEAAMMRIPLGDEVRDPAVRALVDEIVERLAPHAAMDDVEFRVRVVERDDVNAFALPGGQIVVFTGLLRAANGPDEVAGVLAHEIAHVTLRHGLRNVAHRAGLALTIQLLLGDASSWVQLAGEAAVLAQSNDYSREQESAADAEGVRMLLAAGLDPRGLAEFFRLLEDQPGTELSGAMSWLSTHPDHRSRIEHVERLSAGAPPARALEADWEAVKRAVAR